MNDSLTDQSTAFEATILNITDIDQIEPIWRSFEEICQPSFFLTWTWIGPWARLVSQHTDVYLFSLTRNKTQVALCFFTVSNVKRLKGVITSRQVQINEYLENDCNMVTQYNSLLAVKSDLGTAWQYLFDSLKSWSKSWDEIAISSLSEDEVTVIRGIDSFFTQRIDKIHPTWKVPLDDHYKNEDALLGNFKSKSRRQLRQSLKAYRKEVGDVSLKAAKNIEQALEYFEKMESLHTARWVEAGKKGSFANHNWVKFHKEVISVGFPRGEALLAEISCGNLILGYLYGHPYNGTAYMQQTGFIAAQENRFRPGYVSHLMVMLYSADNRLNSYDFLPDDKNSYKKFFTTASEPVYWVRLQRPRIKFYIENFIRYVSNWFRSVSIFKT